jgi:hypothetical protein
MRRVNLFITATLLCTAVAGAEGFLKSDNSTSRIKSFNLNTSTVRVDGNMSSTGTRQVRRKGVVVDFGLASKDSSAEEEAIVPVRELKKSGVALTQSLLESEFSSVVLPAVGLIGLAICCRFVRISYAKHPPQSIGFELNSIRAARKGYSKVDKDEEEFVMIDIYDHPDNKTLNETCFLSDTDDDTEDENEEEIKPSLDVNNSEKIRP